MAEHTLAPLIALVACQYPAGIFDRTPQPEHGTDELFEPHPGPADRTLKRIAQLCDREVWLFATGDQIYRDATAGMFDPAAQDDALEEAYARRNGNARWLAVQSGRNIEALIDDHEIGDNWELSNRGQHNGSLRAQLQTGREAFLRIQRRQQQEEFPLPQGDARVPLWKTGEIGDHRYFLADTRTERSARDPRRLAEARIMSLRQWRRLKAWLLGQHGDAADDENPHRYHFIATPSILLPRRLASAQSPAAALRSDAWDGYPGSLQALLAFIADHRLRHCVFLSGDEHLGCVASVTLRRADRADEPPVRLWSVHTGAMYAPYPFANSIAEDFAAHERFSFTRRSTGGQAIDYLCEVRSWFPATGDGFATIAVGAAGSEAPGLQVSFHSARAGVASAIWQAQADAPVSGPWRSL